MELVMLHLAPKLPEYFYNSSNISLSVRHFNIDIPNK